MPILPYPDRESPPRESEPPDPPPGNAITISPFYHSAVNEVTKPNSLVFVSHYFADRWMRDLGPLGTAIVVCLRSHCYQNRQTGELRDRVQKAVPEIAAEIGVSDKTVRRELERNETLARFVRRRQEYATGPTPRSLRDDAYSYLVAMDDPVHPDDDGLLQETVRRKMAVMEKGYQEPDAKTRALLRDQPPGQIVQAAPKKPPGQSDQAAAGLVKMTTPLDRLTTPLDKVSRPPGQNDQTLKESSESLKNPLNPFPESSLSLFEERNEDGGAETDAPSAGEIAAARAALVVPSEPPKPVTLKQVEAEWQAMPPDEKERFRAEAVRQLQEAGHPAPKEGQVAPTMFKLFWVERKGIVPSGGPGA